MPPVRIAEQIPHGLIKADAKSAGYLQSIENAIKAVSTSVESSASATDLTALDVRVTALEGGGSVTTFTSTDHAITSAATWSESHGLGAAPLKWHGFLVCQTGEYGYTAGQVLAVPLGIGVYTEGGASTNLHYYGVAVTADASNISVTYVDETTAAGSTVFLHLRQDTKIGIFLTNANWKFRVVAEL